MKSVRRTRKCNCRRCQRGRQYQYTAANTAATNEIADYLNHRPSCICLSCTHLNGPLIGNGQ